MKTKIERIKQRSLEFNKLYQECGLCPRKCGVNRLKNEKGFCGSGSETVVYSFGPHFGEEPVLSGEYGSGTIFFSHCVMRCVYCQNHEFSQTGKGKEVSPSELSEIMITLQNKGCHNINLVSPTQYIPKIIEALELAVEKNLRVPIVYNTGGYDAPETIKLLDGIVDIYLPDMRYSSDIMAQKYSLLPEYVENNRNIVKEMFLQVKNIDDNLTTINKGLIIRLLILPHNISGTVKTLEHIADKLSPDVAISLMSQYYPVYKAGSYEKLSRGINLSEYDNVTAQAEALGFHRGWIQPFGSEFDPNLAGDKFKPSF